MTETVSRQPGGTPVRARQIIITAAVALAVVLGVKTYEAKKAA
jgi:negative regulator of sigma E activity